MVNDRIDLETRINSLPLARLEELGEALLDFSQMSDLVAWLNVDRSGRSCVISDRY
ncbi:DUF4351 domain-containing protein [Chamaesiphon sp.]|uniref:DUF4351 domain-containing protein n=1 Tax=Chamaesiphon sp. TaxID=2814140 RepID=UPI0035931C16